MAKRLDTGSVWLFHNNPRGLFFASEGNDSDAVPNRDLLLANLIRASTAAPTYFEPEFIEVARGVKGAFVDGGVSPHNNPALLLMMLATLKGYGFRWSLGADHLMLVSVGTGSPARLPLATSVSSMPAALLAVTALRSMMQDCNWLNQALLQWMGTSPTLWPIDSEIGDLALDEISEKPLLQYVRYDAPLSANWLEEKLGIRLTSAEVAALEALDRPDLAPRLLDIGRRAAENQVLAGSLPCKVRLVRRKFGNQTRMSQDLFAAVEPQARDARPRLALRVGITGSRNLANADHARLEAATGSVLDDIAKAVHESASDRSIGKFYSDAKPILTLISPLAEGADRLVASLAIERKWRLAAPLPFARMEYERDFTDTLKEFCSLLEVAMTDGQLIELDGMRQREQQAYHEVGRFVLHHSDILIAIWDGGPPAKVGGTAQIASEARALGIPIIWINSAPPHLAFFLREDPDDDPVPYQATRTEKLVRQIVEVPQESKAKRPQDKLALEYLVGERVRNSGDEPDFLYRGPFAAPRSLIGWVFPMLLDALSTKVGRSAISDSKPPPTGANNPTVRALYSHAQRADVLATHYARVHRSGFVSIYLLGSLSLVAASTAQFVAHFSTQGERVSSVGSWIELLSLFGILVVVLAERHWRWRERWLDYRLLAELLREADLLAQVGQALPQRSLVRIGRDQKNRAWVPWLATAISRATMPIAANYSAAYLRSVRDYAVGVRLADQIEYYRRAENRHNIVSRRLRRLSYSLFWATVVALIVGLAWPWASREALPSFLAGLFPSIAAASFGIRNQAEFDIVINRSARLHDQLERQSKHIESLNEVRLTRAKLGRAILEAAEILRDDTAEWAGIFEVKESEIA